MPKGHGLAKLVLKLFRVRELELDSFGVRDFRVWGFEG